MYLATGNLYIRKPTHVHKYFVMPVAHMFPIPLPHSIRVNAKYYVRVGGSKRSHGCECACIQRIIYSATAMLVHTPPYPYLHLAVSNGTARDGSPCAMVLLKVNC